MNTETAAAIKSDPDRAARIDRALKFLESEQLTAYSSQRLPNALEDLSTSLSSGIERLKADGGAAVMKELLS